MGLPESATGQAENQEAGRRKRLPGRPRTRRCLLKSCEQRFHPRQARQRYCSGECREAARRWARWKAQQRYRTTAPGQEKRNGQSRRYRERVKNRKPPKPESVKDPARVIPSEDFFRGLLRPAGVLREIRAPAAKSLAALLLTRVPARAGTGARPGAALETSARFNPKILIQGRRSAYIQPVRCNWNFTSSTGVGSTCACAIRRGSGGCSRRWPTVGSKRPLWWWRPKATRTVTWSSTATSGSQRWSNWVETRWRRWYGR
jgi:hypothetical protein